MVLRLWLRRDCCFGLCANRFGEDGFGFGGSGSEWDFSTATVVV